MKRGILLFVAVSLLTINNLSAVEMINAESTVDSVRSETAENLFVIKSDTLVYVSQKETANSGLWFASGTRVYELDKEPSDYEEIYDLTVNKSIFLCLVKSEDPYIIRLWKGENKNELTVSRVKCSSEPVYIIDADNNNIRDYQTDNILSNSASYLINYSKDCLPCVNVDKNGLYFDVTEFVRNGPLYPDVDEKSIKIYRKDDNKNTSYKYGDIDANNSIDLTDFTMISQYMLKDIELTAEQIKCADVNADNEVNLQDLALLKQYVMHDDIKLGVQK